MHLGLGGSVVVNVPRCLLTATSCTVYIDYFLTTHEAQTTSVPLHANIHATGKVHANRVDDCQVTPLDKFKKSAHGTEELRLGTLLTRGGKTIVL